MERPCSPIIMSSQKFPVSSEKVGITLAGLLRQYLPGQSWTQVRRVVETRPVLIGGDLCLDPARRLHEGETVELLGVPRPVAPHKVAISLRDLDHHIVA